MTEYSDFSSREGYNSRTGGGGRNREIRNVIQYKVYHSSKSVHAIHWAGLRCTFQHLMFFSTAASSSPPGKQILTTDRKSISPVQQQQSGGGHKHPPWFTYSLRAPHTHTHICISLSLTSIMPKKSVSECWFKSLSAQSWQYRDRRKQEVGTLPYFLSNNFKCSSWCTAP